MGDWQNLRASLISTSRNEASMRQIQASEAETHLPGLLDEVERGDTIVIMRHGRAIARLVPEVARRDAEIRAAIEDIKAFRRGMPTMSAAERLALIDDGRKY
jgi:prevent-host-death family protein